MLEQRAELWQVIELIQVTLVSLRADNRFLAVDLPDEPPRLSLDWSAEAHDFPDHCLVLVEARFRVDARVPDAEDPSPLMSLDACYQIHYARPAEFTPSQDELEEFARRNGVFNAWPYWRELSHSIYGKMNLPFPPMPVFRVGMVPQHAGEE
ncbi:MAG: hypothetical protein H6740_24100 [Alphaproteobacteria bacterium]|nr:hypothetical protein [Alphaproteobacteria bacterium]